MFDTEPQSGDWLDWETTGQDGNGYGQTITNSYGAQMISGANAAGENQSTLELYQDLGSGEGAGNSASGLYVEAVNQDTSGGATDATAAVIAAGTAGDSDSFGLIIGSNSSIDNEGDGNATGAQIVAHSAGDGGSTGIDLQASGGTGGASGLYVIAQANAGPASGVTASATSVGGAADAVAISVSAAITDGGTGNALAILVSSGLVNLALPSTPGESGTLYSNLGIVTVSP